jgi:hypothetical protein
MSLTVAITIVAIATYDRDHLLSNLLGIVE